MTTDLVKRAALVAKLLDQNPTIGTFHPERPYPVVSLEEYFDGNGDDTSIGGNLFPLLSSQTFWKHLEELNAKLEVFDIVVEVVEVIEDFDEDPPWPYAYTVYIASSVPLNIVENWLKDLKPSYIGLESLSYIGAKNIENSSFRDGLPENMSFYRVAWD